MKFAAAFPDTTSAILFILYMVLFINQGLIVTASQQSDKSYNYSTVTVILITECVKLFFSFVLYLKNEKLKTIWSTLKENKNLLLLYMVPAFLYCLYNNLAFINLKEYDPTTYFILLQLRVMVTGVLFQLIFKKYLSGKQWFSLCLLTVGCVVKIFGNADSSSTGSDHKHIMNFVENIFSFGTIFILLQVFCSCLAGVYNEKLLKHFGNAGVGTLPQNIYMCFNSILFNAIALCFIEDVSKAFSRATLLQLWNVNVVIIILNNAAVGIVTAFFLKSLNSIMKNYASALELIFTAILSWIIFGIKIGIWTILSITLVIYATFLYLENPVINVPAPDLDKEDNVTKSNNYSNLSKVERNI